MPYWYPLSGPALDTSRLPSSRWRAMYDRDTKRIIVTGSEGIDDAEIVRILLYVEMANDPDDKDVRTLFAVLLKTHLESLAYLGGRHAIRSRQGKED